MKQDYSDFLPFPAHPEKERHEPRPASIIEAAKAYKAGQPVTVRATAYDGRNADTESQTFKAGDGIRYDWTSPIYTPANFADWISRTKAFFRDWFYGMDRVFFSYYIG